MGKISPLLRKRNRHYKREHFKSQHFVLMNLLSKFAFVGLLSGNLVMADSTIDSGKASAYAANTGWLNLRPDQPSSPEGIVFREAYLSGRAYGANIGWIDFGDGTPVNGFAYANHSHSDFGVNHDGLGNLSGYAYGANVGWINFGWDSSYIHPDRPRVNMLTGEFLGYAYGANIGWIHLGAGELITMRMDMVDTDNDHIDDAWEYRQFGDLSASGSTDDDGDGSTDLAEFRAGTDPADELDFLDIVFHEFDDSAGEATVAFTSKPGRLYRIESCSNMGVAPDRWADSGLGLFTGDSGTTTMRSVSWPEVDRWFIRITPARPLSP